MIFIDVGHSHSTVCLSKITQLEATVLAQHSDRNFGGRNIDRALQNKFIELFNEKYEGSDISQNYKAKQRLGAAAQKARQALSSDHSTKIKEDALMPGKDFTHELLEDEFEQTIEEEVDRFWKFLFNAKEEFKKLEDFRIDVIELVGDTNRLPVLEEVIKEIFPETNKELKRTLNSQEYLARGAAILAAQFSRHKTAHRYRVKNQLSHDWREKDQELRESGQTMQQLMSIEEMI